MKPKIESHEKKSHDRVHKTVPEERDDLISPPFPLPKSSKLQYLVVGKLLSLSSLPKD